MADLLPQMDSESLGKAGELLKNTAGYIKIAEIIQKLLGERAAMLLFGKKTSLEIDRARSLMEVEIEKKLYSDALDTFAGTEAGKQMQQIVAESLFHQQFKKLDNIEKVASIAAEQIDLSRSPIPQEMVDDDWLTRCLEYAGDSSTEEMQALWGRILAGEILKPESFSLRTLDFLRNIDRRDAEVVNDLSQRAFLINNTCFLANTVDHYTEDNNLGLNFRDIHYLKDLGVLSLESRRVNLTIAHSTDHRHNYISVQHGRYTLFFDVDTQLYNISIPAIQLTTMGEQLRRLVDLTINVSVIKHLYDLIAAALGESGIVKQCSYAENDYIVPAKYSRGQMIMLYSRGSRVGEHKVCL